MPGRRRRRQSHKEEVGPLGECHRVGDELPLAGIGFGRDIAVGDVQVESHQALGDLETDPAEPEHPRPLAPNPALQLVQALVRPRPAARPRLCADHATRLREHHRHPQVGHIAGQHVWSVGDADPAGPAGVQVDRVIAHAVDRDDLQVRAGRDQGSVGTKLAPGGDPADLRPDLGQERPLVSCLEVPVHGEGRLQRLLIPRGVRTNLKNMGRCHGNSSLDLGRTDTKVSTDQCCQDATSKRSPPAAGCGPPSADVEVAAHHLVQQALLLQQLGAQVMVAVTLQPGRPGIDQPRREDVVGFVTCALVEQPFGRLEA